MNYAIETRKAQETTLEKFFTPDPISLCHFSFDDVVWRPYKKVQLCKTKQDKTKYDRLFELVCYSFVPDPSHYLFRRLKRKNYQSSHTSHPSNLHLLNLSLKSNPNPNPSLFLLQVLFPLQYLLQHLPSNWRVKICLQ